MPTMKNSGGLGGVTEWVGSRRECDGGRNSGDLSRFQHMDESRFGQIGWLAQVG